MIDEKQLVSTDGAAAICGVTRRAFEYLLKRPGAPKPTLVCGKRVFDRREVAAWDRVRPKQRRPS